MSRLRRERLPGVLRAPARLARRAARELVGPDPDPRRRLGLRYLRGDGIEIGALATRFPVARGATVRYVDRITVQEMREHYPELAALDLVPPDILDDGAVLSSVPDASLDFVVASHVLEHLEDPIGALASHLRTLRPGGVLLLAVPDKRRTFDEARPTTTIDHLERDHTEGPAWSRRGHYEEWVRDVNRLTDGAAATVERLLRQQYAIHFHVWTPATFLTFLAHCRDGHGLPLELELFERAEAEFFVVLAKTTGDQAATSRSEAGSEVGEIPSSES